MSKKIEFQIYSPGYGTWGEDVYTDIESALSDLEWVREYHPPYEWQLNYRHVEEWRPYSA